jgi:hypothetical protein
MDERGEDDLLALLGAACNDGWAYHVYADP